MASLVTSLIGYQPLRAIGVLAAMIIKDASKELTRFIASLPLSLFAAQMVSRIILAFLMHRGRMSCSQASVAIRSDPLHRSQVTRFLGRKRWRKNDFNNPARRRLLRLEARRGPFLLVIDATLVGQAGKRTENTYSTGSKSRGKRRKKARCHKYTYARRSCHSFTFAVLITPSGYRIPFQMPHYTHEYCERFDIIHYTTAEAAAAMIDKLEVPAGAEVYVLGDTAYEAQAVQNACKGRNFWWVCPANPERVFEGPKGQRPKVRDRLKDTSCLRPQRIRTRASEGPFAEHRRLSTWRIGSKAKPRTYSVHQETTQVRSVGRVSLVFSTTKEDLRAAEPKDVLVLMTNATHLKARQIVDLYACRWQIELFFKELKSRLGFDQYRLRKFEAALAWVELAITAVLFLETLRAEKLNDRKLDRKAREWWRVQRLHGLCEAVIQKAEANELKFVADRLKTRGGIAKLARLIGLGSPKEYRHVG